MLSWALPGAGLVTSLKRTHVSASLCHLEQMFALVCPLLCAEVCEPFSKASIGLYHIWVPTLLGADVRNTQQHCHLQAALQKDANALKPPAACRCAHQPAALSHRAGRLWAAHERLCPAWGPAWQPPDQWPASGPCRLPLPARPMLQPALQQPRCPGRGSGNHAPPLQRLHWQLARLLLPPMAMAQRLHRPRRLQRGATAAPAGTVWCTAVGGVGALPFPSRGRP